MKFRLIRESFPAVWSWVRKFEDLSGLEDGHCDNQQFLKDMLTFAGEVYFPFLAANRAAIAGGQQEVQVDLWKENPIAHTQPVFKYQDKCFQRIKDSFNSLSETDKERAATLMEGTYCLQYLAI